jgi:hypothetical protein
MLPELTTMPVALKTPMPAMPPEIDAEAALVTEPPDSR